MKVQLNGKPTRRKDVVLATSIANKPERVRERFSI